MKELYTLAEKEKTETNDFAQSILYKYDVLKTDEKMIEWIKGMDLEPILKREAKSIWNMYIVPTDAEW